MVPELRAMRLKEIAARVKDEYAGDLRSALVGPIGQVRKLLKKVPNIADPSADRILLFGRVAPVAAVPSNCPHVLVRIQRGQERESYAVTYREAQQAIMAEVPEKFDARIRAYLLLKRHGQALCKRTRPRCSECPVSAPCAYFVGTVVGNEPRVITLGKDYGGSQYPSFQVRDYTGRWTERSRLPTTSLLIRNNFLFARHSPDSRQLIG